MSKNSNLESFSTTLDLISIIVEGKQNQNLFLFDADVIKIQKANLNKKESNNVWMSHADEVTKLPKGFKVVAKTETSKFSIIENPKKKLYGIQFHPEVNLKMHLRWLYFAGYMLREKGAQKRNYQMQQRLSHGKKINMWLDSFLDNYLLRDHK